MTTYSTKTGLPESEVTFEGSRAVCDRDKALFEGRKFRAYREFTSNTTIKLVATKPFYLTLQKLWCGKGAARVAVKTGATESGTFTTMPTKFSLRTVAPVNAGLITLAVGGTVTGGTEREVLRADSGTSGGGAGNTDELGSTRYLTAGTYYLDIVVTGTTDGKLVLEWEEEQ